MGSLQGFCLEGAWKQGLERTEGLFEAHRFISGYWHDKICPFGTRKEGAVPRVWSVVLYFGC